MEPPPCVQNAMMTKDKKPFTYTPGGIDLSEVRSPRMARRIERNAHLPGSGEGPRPAAHAQQNVDRLPASALAAMRPQPQVQVFPSPPPAMPFKGAVPPPPPPPSQGIPPPPPPPTAPLPTQKVKTGDNQVLERPDMTKIIPDNPMSLLRKTGGPQPRKSLVDEIFAQGDKPQNRYQQNNDRAVPVPPAQAQSQYQQRPQQYQQQPQVEQYRPQSQQYQQQPQVEQYRPQSQQYQQQPQVEQYRPQSQQYQQQPQVEQNRPQSQQYQQQPQVDQYRPQSQQYQQQPQVEQYRPQSQQYQQQPQVEQYRPQPQQYQQQPQVEQYRPQQYQQQPQQYQQQPQQYQQQHKSPEAVKEPPRYQPPVIERQPAKTYQEPQPEVKTSTAHLGSLYIPPVDQQKRIVPERNQDSPKMDSPSLREAPKPWQIKKTQQEETPVWAKKENQNTPSPAAAVKEQQTWPQTRPAQQPVGVRIEIRTKPQPEYHLEADERSPNAVYVTQPLVLQHPGPRMTSQPDQRERRNEQRGERIIPIKIEGATQAERTFQRQQSNPTQSNKFKIIQKFTNTEEDQAETSPVTEHSPKFPQNFQQQVSRGPQQSSNNGPYIRTVPVELEDNEKQQQYVHPSEQVVPEPKKYMGSSIPGRSFRILQAMTAPNNNCANATDQNEAFQYDEWDYTRPYLPYPYPPYWPPPPYPYPPSDNESTPRKTPTPRDPPQPYWHYPHSESDFPPFPPFWGYPNENTETCSNCRNTPISWSHQDYDYYPHYFDPYYYYYYYGYPPVYPHYPHYDSETPGEQQDGVKPPDEAPGAEDDLEVKVTSASPLLEEDTEEEYEDELSNDASDENQTDSEADDIDNPHQLSVIMEESERTESRMRSESVLSNTTIADNSDDEAECSAAKLSLPLKLCVTLTDEPIKQVVVGDGSVKTFDDTELHASFTLKSPSSTPKKTSPCRFDDSEEIEEAAEAEVILEEQEVVAAGDDGKESDDSEDWWGIIGKEDDMPVRKKNSSSPPADVVEQSTDPATGGAEKPAPSEDVGEDSFCHQTSKKSVYESVEEDKECDGKLMLVDDFASQFAQIQENFGSWNLKVLKKLDIRKKAPNNAEAEEVEVASSSAGYTGYNFSKSTTLFDIQQGTEVTKPYTPVELDSDSSSDESQSCSEADKQPTEEVKVPTIKERIQALKNSIEEKERKLQENKIEVQVSRSKTTSTKSSIKSLEDFSEEELDSGVTSDMSRHISDSEEFPELRRLSRYQRAATHSRLYKLLQDECEIEEVVEQSFRRDKLSLPLNDKERLIEETVQSFLKHKKAQVFRNVAEDKLRAAAARILGEELELSPSTSSSSFLSPQRNSTGYSTTVPTPQEFNGNHDEYVQYYDSWMNADTRGDYAVGKDSCWGSSQRGGGAKCPRIPSPQNLHQKMIRLLERPDNAS